MLDKDAGVAQSHSIACFLVCNIIGDLNLAPMNMYRT